MNMTTYTMLEHIVRMWPCLHDAPSSHTAVHVCKTITGNACFPILALSHDQCLHCLMCLRTAWCMRLLLPPAGSAEPQDGALHWTASDTCLPSAEHIMNTAQLQLYNIDGISRLSCADGMACTPKEDAVLLMLQEARPWDERMACAVAVMLHRCCHTSLLQVPHLKLLLDVKVC